MGEIALGMASSHAFAVMDPAEWDAFRLQNRRGYERRYGLLPAENARIPAETEAVIASEFAPIREGFTKLRLSLERVRPDVLILVADDQNENFTTTIPQLAVYTGERFLDGKADRQATERKAHPGLAAAILR